MWIDHKKQPPILDGYYLTYYFNPEQQAFFYKALIWHKDQWVPPAKRWTTPVDVRGYINVHHKFYVAAQFQVRDEKIPPFNLTEPVDET
jgi:hypothetical protein